MGSFADNFTNLFSFLTIISQLLVVVLVILLISSKTNKILIFFISNFLLFGFIISLTATLGSLIFSKVIGWNPCELCWYQRILMYPQVLLFSLALWKKDHKIADYSLLLSLIGVLIAAYHYYGQIFSSGALACPVVGSITGCAQKIFVKFGYVTLPMMSLTAFVLLILLAWLFNRKNKIDINARR
jgi:disulfide bond formation protein DsbB